MSTQSVLSKLSRVLLIAMLAMGLSTAAEAQIKDWTTVGSAGAVDEADTGIVLLGSPTAGAVTMPAEAIGTLNIRYNVVAVDSIFGGSLVFRASLRDNGPDARVIVRLKQYGLSTGVTTTLLTLDSNSFPASSRFQVQRAGPDCSGASLNFFENAYFMDVEIIKTNPAGKPALAAIHLSVTAC